MCYVILFKKTNHNTTMYNTFINIVDQNVMWLI